MPVILLFILLALVPTCAWAQADTRMRVGILEFDEKNSIGTEDARTVVPGMLATHLHRIGKYHLEERVFLRKVLEEQALSLSGFIPDEEAVEVGKLHGVDAIVAGSVMKIGRRYILTARMVSVSTGSVISSAHVEFAKPEGLDAAVEETAYLISGWSPRQYFTLKTQRALSEHRFGARIGTGWGQNRIEEWHEEESLWYYDAATETDIAGFALDFFYHGPWLDLDVGGVIPNHVGALTASVAVYPTTHLGLAYCSFWTIDEVERGGWERGAFRWRSDLGGFSFRVSPNLRFAILKGITKPGSATLRYQDFGEETPSVPLKQQFDFLTGPTMATAELSFSERYSVRMQYFHDQERSPVVYDPDARQLHGLTRMILLSFGYSLGI